MKIALMMENSQAAKNVTVLKELEGVAQPLGHQVFNVGMSDEQDHHLTYIHLGIQASVLRFIFEKAFTGEKGNGYPPERKEPQVRNAGLLNQVKAAVIKENYLDTLRAIDPELVRTAVSGPRFQQCLFEHGKNQEIVAFVRQLTH